MDKQQLFKTLKLILYIAVFSFVIDKIVFVSLNLISDKVYSGQAIGKLNHYLKVKDSLKLITFGSSRANHHINVDLLDASSFNMGMDGMFIAHSAILIKLLPLGQEQTVILHFDPNDAYNTEYTGEEIKSLMVKYHRNSLVKTEIQNANQDHFLQHFYWSLDYNGMVLGILKNAVAPKYDYRFYTGYDPLNMNTTQKEIFKISLAQKKSVKCQDNLQINPIFKNNLEAIRGFCKSNNKKLIVVTSPFYDDQCKNDNIKLSEFLKDLNIRYYDYSDFLNENNAFEYWKDETHMSRIGAELFSKAFRNELLNQNLIN
jgi:hypothetical protein